MRLRSSPEVTLKGFDSIVVELGYEFVYFDGLNRFYVSNGHPEFKATSGPGPSVFDQAVLAGLSTAPFCEKIKAESADLYNELSAHGNEAAQLTQSFEAERAKVPTLSDGFAKAALAREQTKTTLAAELVAKNLEIAKRKDRISRLESGSGST